MIYCSYQILHSASAKIDFWSIQWSFQNFAINNTKFRSKECLAISKKSNKWFNVSLKNEAIFAIFPTSRHKFMGPKIKDSLK